MYQDAIHRGLVRRGLRIARAAAAGAAGLVVAGCGGGFSETLGLNYDSPNPFNVSPRAPLRLPGDLSALPPPRPGAPSPLEPQPTRSARAALSNAGAPTPAEAGPSPSEVALLDAAGAASADPNVRTSLTGEVPRAEQEYALGSLLGLSVPDGSEKEILEPREEARRIRDAGGVTPNPTPPPEERKTNEIVIPIQ